LNMPSHTGIDLGRQGMHKLLRQGDLLLVR
jgi:hypothetical protein